MPDVALVVTGAGEVPGGVTSHVHDLRDSLAEQGWSCAIVTPRTAVLERLRGRGRGVLHFHVSHPRRVRLLVLLAMITAVGKNRAVVSFHHGGAVNHYRGDRIDMVLLTLLFRRLGGSVALTRPQVPFFKQLAPHKPVAVSGSYVRTGTSETQGRRAGAEEGRGAATWVVSSGYELPAYGYAELVDALAAAPEEQRIGLKLFTYGPRGDALMQRIEAMAKAQGVPFRHIRGQSRDAFLAELVTARAYVRNTSVDTFGLAVAEAMSLGVPAIATSVCARPPGTILVDASAPLELTRAVVDVVGSVRRESPTADLMAHAQQNVAAVLGLYQSIAGSRRGTFRAVGGAA